METGHSHFPPRSILLATDLSGRCDRALDRAVQLATQWQARLVIVHALEQDHQFPEATRDVPSWRRDQASRAAFARRQIQADLLDSGVPFDTVIEEGEPWTVVLKAAETFACELIITGIARETFGRLILGAPVDHLVRRSALPVLIVKTRARRAYHKVMVATDFSDGARAALQGAAGLFPDLATTLLHCSRSLPDGLGGTRAGDEASHRLLAGECARFVDASGLAPEYCRNLQVLVEPGDIESLVKAYAADKGLDLLVIGSQGRGAVATFLLGSTAEKLLISAPCDILVVRGVPAKSSRA